MLIGVQVLLNRVVSLGLSFFDIIFILDTFGSIQSILLLVVTKERLSLVLVVGGIVLLFEIFFLCFFSFLYNFYILYELLFLLFLINVLRGWFYASNDYIEYADERKNDTGCEVNWSRIIKQKNANEKEKEAFTNICDQNFNIFQNVNVLVLCSSQEKTEYVQIKSER